eukprot:CAMPEP_0116897946 /NCGR_PEP_ID=MMETSP0467-20121206/6778_1 /TAXON_ID=283647 /ORGANISM="Mesodinium pulex, Strain SPMC105" /LENGTH=45 /DNA_ID= /DNA_START= /DNA_END= /DNA_ORIENTATION=
MTFENTIIEPKSNKLEVKIEDMILIDSTADEDVVIENQEKYPKPI